MNQRMTSHLLQLSTSIPNRNLLFLYRKVVYLFILLWLLFQLPLATALWSDQAAFVPTFFEGNWILQSFNLLSHPGLTNFYPLCIALLIAAIILSFFIKGQFLIAVIVYFCFSNLYYRTIVLQNGSGDLLHAQLFFLLFINENAEEQPFGKWRTFRIALTNIAFLSSKFQVVFVYVVSALYKLDGSHWLEGSALHYVLLNPTYSVDVVMQLVPKMELPLRLFTWLILLFQLLFPLLIWNRKLKPALVIFGILLHLTIAFVMGIMDFGLLMVVMYVLFANENWAKRMKQKFVNKHTT